MEAVDKVDGGGENAYVNTLVAIRPCWKLR